MDGGGGIYNEHRKIIIWFIATELHFKIFITK